MAVFESNTLDKVYLKESIEMISSIFSLEDIYYLLELLNLVE